MSQISTAKPVLGRPKIFTPAIAEHLATLISQTGLSDSAAARQLGLSTSSLGRWKQQSPELALALLQAREAFRLAQLDLILAAAQAPGSGWRAAAWLLERVFPEDYHPNAIQRAKHQELAALREAEALASAFPETEEPITPPASVPASPKFPKLQAHRHPFPKFPKLPALRSRRSASVPRPCDSPFHRLPFPKFPKCPASHPLHLHPGRCLRALGWWFVLTSQDRLSRSGHVSVSGSFATRPLRDFRGAS